MTARRRKSSSAKGNGGTPEERIRAFYGFPFPDDFFVFREFLTRLAPNLLGDACDMYLSFPFEVADGGTAGDHPEHPHWQDRYYCDLPEFVTIFTGTTDGLHWGYFFDDPGKRDPVVAHYWHSDTFEHAHDGNTIFEAVRHQVELSERDYQEMSDRESERDYCRIRLEQLGAIREQLAAFWGADRRETGDEYCRAYRSRRTGVVAATWDRMGVVVPREEYRALSAISSRATDCPTSTRSK